MLTRDTVACAFEALQTFGHVPNWRSVPEGDVAIENWHRVLGRAGVADDELRDLVDTWAAQAKSSDWPHVGAVLKLLEQSRRSRRDRRALELGAEFKRLLALAVRASASDEDREVAGEIFAQHAGPLFYGALGLPLPIQAALDVVGGYRGLLKAGAAGEARFVEAAAIAAKSMPGEAPGATVSQVRRPALYLVGERVIEPPRAITGPVRATPKRIAGPTKLGQVLDLSRRRDEP